MKKQSLFKAALLSAVGLFVTCAYAIAPAVQPHDALTFGALGMLINRENLNAMYNGFKAAFVKAFSGVQPVWSSVATLVPSTAKTENYGWLGQMPRLREWVGDRLVKSIAASGYAITNKKFESTIGVPREDIEDDGYGVFASLFSEMGYAAATHPDELVFSLLAAGFTTNCYDGQYFFDVDHPVGSGVVSNHGGGSSTPWFLLDTSRPLKPLIFQKRREYALNALTDPKDEGVFMRDEYRYGVDARCNVGFGFWQMAFGSKVTLDATGYAAARSAMQSFKSDEGRPLGVKPNLLVVPPSLEAAAFAVVGAEKLANGQDNPFYNTAQILVCPWLS